MNENPEQNETPEFQLPEMQAGQNGMYSISAMDGIKMGPIVIQAFMQKLREAAELANLEVKVEPTRGQLLIWWYPRTEPTFLEDLAQHISVVPAGEMDVVLGMIELDMEELIEGLKKLSGDLHCGINVKPDVLSEVPSVHLTWGPLPGLPESGIAPREKMERTYLDAVMEYVDENARGKTTVSKKHMLTETLQSMEQLLAFFEHVGEQAQKQFSLIHQPSSDEIVLHWRPMSEKELAWPSLTD